uniref:Calcium-binding and coiled-coil domain-containing protein 2 n=1 Tax=Crocodylus porosus TaxID=8502 RepID=A0A7M4FVG4_CROPO
MMSWMSRGMLAWISIRGVTSLGSIRGMISQVSMGYDAMDPFGPCSLFQCARAFCMSSCGSPASPFFQGLVSIPQPPWVVQTLFPHGLSVCADHSPPAPAGSAFRPPRELQLPASPAGGCPQKYSGCGGGGGAKGSALPGLLLLSRSPRGFELSPLNSSMDENVDEPPTSTILLDSCHFSQVIFTNVEKYYMPGGDVTCYYTLTKNITPRRKDWVGIFRVGWKTTREYYTFMWAHLPSSLDSNAVLQQEVQFKAYYLPKDDEYYQFCYVDQDGVVRGASVPFQFRAEAEDDILVVTTQGEVEEIEQQNKDLLKENQQLKESCKSLQKQNIDLQEELRKAQELCSGLDSLKGSSEKLELELNSLREENRHLKEQNACRDAELHQLKEQSQSISSEKEQLGNRLKATLDQVDQLQSQVLSQEKEIENLVRIDRDKTEQLEHLEKEKHQLHITLVEQKEHAKKLEHTLENSNVTENNTFLRLQHVQFQSQDLTKKLEEKNHLFQILQRKKDELDEENQLLKQENSDLLRRLSALPDYSSFAAASPMYVQVPPEDTGLVFGNPYASPKTSAENMSSLKKCPWNTASFPEDIEESQYENHVQSHLLECPYCSQIFDGSSKQVYEDHLFCHNLE